MGRTDSQIAGNAALALSLMGDSKVAHDWAVQRLAAEVPKKDVNSQDSFGRHFAGKILAHIGTVEDVQLIEKNDLHLGTDVEWTRGQILKRAGKSE